jgi:hypothetical protein
VRHCNTPLILSVIEIPFHFVRAAEAFDPDPNRSRRQDMPGAADYSALGDHFLVKTTMPAAVKARSTPHDVSGQCFAALARQ